MGTNSRGEESACWDSRVKTPKHSPSVGKVRRGFPRSIAVMVALPLYEVARGRTSTALREHPIHSPLQMPVDGNWGGRRAQDASGEKGRIRWAKGGQFGHVDDRVYAEGGGQR